MHATAPPDAITLLGAPATLARSMAHALRQAWLDQGHGAGWQCLAPEMQDPLPPAADIYLLGLDWQALQETETAAAAQHQYWRERLHSEGRGYVVLYGSPARQWQQLAQSLMARQPQADWSWLPAGEPARQGGRLRPWGCEQCSDPDCERRLFDALRGHT
ncbi:hypothetical protein [Delftia sp. PS-11]|uniref:hypothetical protein n=1 Tax=Delftia sp. PS-11 TaxID=2767222 RepID=UPI0024556B6B|nr:hypothetical protein [Delftia sp. PS-11]